MAEHNVSFSGGLEAAVVFTADVRTSLTSQFLMAAAMQARAAAELESRPASALTEDDRIAHKGFVVGAIMQACAALECEIWEVIVHGPGHHLGSSGLDITARHFLAPAADAIDGEGVLERYRLVLHLLHRPALDWGSQPCQDAALVIKLRNELVHYKSRWSSELDRASLFRALRGKRLRRPSFMVVGASFFPHECLSADCADWAVRSCVALLDAFYVNLGLPGRLDPFRDRLTKVLV
jgi:hypothetical protein